MTDHHLGTFEEGYRRSGLPVGDRDAWIDVLLTYPRDTELCTGVEMSADRALARKAVDWGEIPDDRDVIDAYTWQMTRNRLGPEVLLDGLDAASVSGYVQHGGTLAEAQGYLDAVTNAQVQEGYWWRVWAIFELSFSGARFEGYRRMGASPADLRWFVNVGAFTKANAVGIVHRWGLTACPDAPWVVAAAYKIHGLTAAEIASWEERRTQGEDVVLALEVLAALAGDPR